MWVISIVVVVLYISDTTMASAITWEEFQHKAEKWNEDDKYLIQSVKETVPITSTLGIVSDGASSPASPWPEGIKAKYDQAFLFIAAPVKDEVAHNKKMCEVSEEMAKEQRIFEFRHYCASHPDLKNLHIRSRDKFDPLSNTHFIHECDTGILLQLTSVYSYGEMKVIVQDFMEKYGSKATVAHVYFNGHGAPLDNTHSQLVFKEPMKEDENLDTVQADMSDILNESNKSGLLEKMHFVFCQCHAHLRQEVQNPLMNVVHFTSERAKKTHVTGYFQSNRDKIVTVTDSRHTELQSYVSKLAERME